MESIDPDFQRLPGYLTIILVHPLRCGSHTPFPAMSIYITYVNRVYTGGTYISSDVIRVSYTGPFTVLTHKDSWSLVVVSL